MRTMELKLGYTREQTRHMEDEPRTYYGQRQGPGFSS
jgi:hypothetical protein